MEALNALQNPPPHAEAQPDLAASTARLRSCPFKTASCPRAARKPHLDTMRESKSESVYRGHLPPRTVSNEPCELRRGPIIPFRMRPSDAMCVAAGLPEFFQ